jgi:hypothetical protein
MALVKILKSSVVDKNTADYYHWYDHFHIQLAADAERSLYHRLRASCHRLQVVMLTGGEATHGKVSILFFDYIAAARRDVIGLDVILLDLSPLPWSMATCMTSLSQFQQRELTGL